jgi:hypothetical protein
MDITLAELADVIDDPFVAKEILRALKDFEDGGVDDTDALLLIENASALLLLNDKLIVGTLAMLGVPAAMAIMMVS